jgi:formylglycine-generating enzyme required for sulfatase activity
MKARYFNFFATVLLLGISTSAYSDDSYVTVQGGAAQAMKEHPTVSMDEEYVKLVLHESSYTVRADFTFYNAGPSTTVAVGFPFGGHDPRGASQLQNYKTWVNGVAVETTDVRHHEELQEDLYYFPQIWRVKDVTFPSKKMTTTAVSYTAPYGANYQSEMVASYIYGSGRTWTGPIKKAIFDLNFDDGMLIEVPCSDAYRLTHRSLGQMVLEMNNYEPKRIGEGIGLSVISLNSLFKGLTNDPAAIENRFNGKDRYCSNKLGNTEGEEECRRAQDLLTREADRYGCKGNLQTLSLTQLRLLRNSVFAKRGRVFTDPELDRYFRIFPWYKPKPNDILLFDEDKQLIEEISAREAIIKKTPPYVFSSDTVSRDNIKASSQTIEGKAGVEWVSLPGGNFMMGCESAKPVHKVTIRPFEMAKTLVTFKQYQACINAGVCIPPQGKCLDKKFVGDNRPIVCLEWSQAKVFSDWVGGRLPTEAEWEYASRSAGMDWQYPWGNEPATCERAVMADNTGRGCGRDATWDVCSKPSGNTKQGLCDMIGNVAEWVADHAHSSYEGAPSDGSAWLRSPYEGHARRAGGWSDPASNLNSCYSYGDDSYDLHVGFRPVRLSH